MNLFWARAENVTLALRFESSHRFKILRLRKVAAARVGDHQVVFGGSRDESFSLRETRLHESLSTFVAPPSLETSADYGSARTCKSAAVCALATLSKGLAESNP